MTTLHTKIEAAKALVEALREQGFGTRSDNALPAEFDTLVDALASLPKVSMTETEILAIIVEKVIGKANNDIFQRIAEEMCLDVIRALKDAGVLYVKE